jgi:hypothetical protein
MTATAWLRIGAGLTLFLAVGHTFGAVLAEPSHGPEEVALQSAMRAFRVVEMGVERSYWDFYHGSAWAITALVLATAAAMWFTASFAPRVPREVRPLIVTMAAAYAAVTVISSIYFVTAPIVVSALITLCLCAAALNLKSSEPK